MAEAEAEAIPSSSKDVDVEVVHVESSQTPSSGNKSQARAKASPYVVFVPSKFFEKITSNEKSTVYKCLLGCPSTRTTTVFHSSLMNARRHITTYHRARLSDFNAAFAAGKSAANDKTSPCQSMDKHLVNLKESTTNKQVLTQADLDTKIMKFIIKDSLSIREVEREGFRDLMGSLVGKLVVKKRTYFTERLQTEYSNTKTNLILALESALHVSTTADLWSGRRRSFLGMTVHWLGSDLSRCSACLAVRRVIGSHTFDVIAKLIDSIHKEFGISSKVNCTITDNGSNFLKAFNVFGPNTATSEPEDEDEEDLEDDDDFDFIDIGEIFDRHSQECADKEATTSEESDDDNINVAVTEKERIKLPRHMRCSCHLLNLIATTDVSNISNAAFKKLKRRIEAKLQAIWNKQARSSLASDYIKSKLGVLFVLYNVTRWNSFFDSVECVTKLIGSKNEELAEVFHHFNIAPLTKTEEEFLIEYVRIMEPFTQALDVLQNEEKMSIGCVLPTIRLLQETMTEFSKDISIVHCQPLVSAVLLGLEKRFGLMFHNNHLRLASISDPNFKTIWADEEEKAQLITLLRSVVRRHQSTDSTPDQGNANIPSPAKKTRFLDGFKKKRTSIESDEVDSYLSEGTGELSSLDRFPTIKKIFLEYNSALASSAACERVFSCAGLIFTAKRTNLTDGNFEALVFLKLNGDCCRLWANNPSKTSKK